MTRYKGMSKTWMIEGVAVINESAKTIRITELPPLMKYGSFLKKIEGVLENHSVKMINNSSTNIDIALQFTGKKEEWQVFVNSVEKSIKMLITETPVFVKDGLVIEYDRIEDYINDYRYRLADLKVRRVQHFKQLNDDELLFLIYKEKYLMFMLAGKGKMRTDSEVDEFLGELTKEHQHIRRRLDSILLRSLTEQELQRTRERIVFLRQEIKKQEEELALAIKEFEIAEDTALSRATQNRSASSIDLFADEEEIDGIEVFQQTLEEETEEL